MPKFSNAFSLTVCMLLASCGGGGGGPVVSSVETKLDHGSNPTIVFNFYFSEPIPSFSADVVTVKGGTKGSLTWNSDKTVYFLEVTRDGNNDNEINVSVGPGAFQDAAGIFNVVGASATHVYDHNLVWQDEFNAAGAIDPTRWTYDTGTGPNGDGWGNGELETYTNSAANSFIRSDGYLHIKALPVSATCDPAGGGCTSARLKTQGKMEFTYGFVEVRAQLPCSQGAWPAIWMLHDPVTWPNSGEIDVAEWFGKDNDPAKISATLHYGSDPNHPTTSGNTTLAPDVCNAFHRYQLNWTADKIQIGVDDVQYLEYLNSGGGSTVWPFDQPFHLLLNVAVGGPNGGGNTIANLAPDGYEMKVDYVRVYKIKP